MSFLFFYGLKLMIRSTIYLDRIEVGKERRRASGMSVVCRRFMAIAS